MRNFDLTKKRKFHTVEGKKNESLSISRNFCKCGDYRIFLSLRFHVKSILTFLESRKLPICQYLEALNLTFEKFHALEDCKNSKLQFLNF